MSERESACMRVYVCACVYACVHACACMRVFMSVCRTSSRRSLMKSGTSCSSVLALPRMGPSVGSTDATDMRTYWLLHTTQSRKTTNRAKAKEMGKRTPNWSVRHSDGIDCTQHASQQHHQYQHQQHQKAHEGRLTCRYRALRPAAAGWS